MTEYDYSPAAYERYLATQTRVSNWVSRTTEQAHQYSNPFVLSPAQAARTPDQLYPVSPSSDSRPIPTRSKTLPHRDAPYYSTTPSPSSRPSRSRSHSYSDTKPSKHRSRPQPHSRAPSQHRSHHTTYQITYPSPTPQYRHPQSSRAHTGPVTYRTHQTGSSGPIYLPTPRTGHSYYVVPPGGAGVKVEYGDYHQVKSKPQPLLKRLFSFMSPSNGSSRGSSKGSTATLRKDSPRRSSY
ncbi:hypothetical protein BJ138DRAFT_1070454 [Hygrophoropsis aurantiaca]|uniref:Uncharacterized protein n=1 Tax=Hygrophoropsis aurantiaca TaxID=72124 RepID=A0ACB8A3Q7_9AGAM|nr:hypothetical protein BJ138DRAFT_1070454 [Hygrophoropsis aurantiaca]